MQVRGWGVRGQGADTTGEALAQEPEPGVLAAGPPGTCCVNGENSNPCCCSRRACDSSGTSPRQGSLLWLLLSCPVPRAAFIPWGPGELARPVRWNPQSLAPGPSAPETPGTHLKCTFAHAGVAQWVGRRSAN